jgi:putative spermidine/putrescine transport system permease protein
MAAGVKRLGAVRAVVPTRGWGWCLLPGFALLAVLFGWPLVDVGVRSLTDPSPHNYDVFVESSVYRNAYLTTFRVALVSTVACLALGYPYAYLMHVSSGRTAVLLAFFVLLPFWTSILVRTYAWTVWLQDTGIVNRALIGLGLTDAPLALMRNSLGTTIGMTGVLLPFMVLSLYAGMRRIDPDLTRAAQSMGATPFTAFRRVFVPLSTPGIYAGCLIVFVISLGFYLTPAILGDPGHPLVAQLIVDQVQRQFAFGVGSALGMALLALTLLVLWLGTRFVDFETVVGQKS